MPFLKIGDPDPPTNAFTVPPSVAKPRKVPKLATVTLGPPMVRPAGGSYKTPKNRRQIAVALRKRLRPSDS